MHLKTYERSIGEGDTVLVHVEWNPNGSVFVKVFDALWQSQYPIRYDDGKIVYDDPGKLSIKTKRTVEAAFRWIDDHGLGLRKKNVVMVVNSSSKAKGFALRNIETNAEFGWWIKRSLAAKVALEKYNHEEIKYE